MRFSNEGHQPLLWTNSTETVEGEKPTAGETKVSGGTWGHAVQNTIEGSDFSIHIFEFRLLQPANFVISSSELAPVFMIAWDGECTVKAGGVTTQHLPPKHFNIVFTLQADFELQFKEKGKYRLLIIFLKQALLAEYGMYSARLHSFITNVGHAKPGTLLPKPQFCSIELTEVIHKIVKCRVRPNLQGLYFILIVKELMTLATDWVSSISEGQMHLELYYAEKARQIILHDFEVFHTVKQLAKLCGTTDVLLQQAFKKVYGQSVGKFSREVRLLEAYRLLNETDYPLRIVSTMVGYNEAPNFFTAFKKQYGFTPGTIQKKQKKI